ncbi:MAG: ATP-binding cassette domain-containing protein [Clostridiales bacterium]|jgi:energy-coupling factor transport system ATP-binding protein|nr:ATP-binding cassette domain-containing protein [Clostridiales bacterium]
MEAYQIECLNFTYPNREKAALANISLSIERGEFVTLCGPSGCGKTTLLRQLKPSAAPHGIKEGSIRFEGKALEDLSAREAASKIGFVFQSPENQIVTDKVWHELAFGLESLGFSTQEIRLRVAEMASFFGIQAWFHTDVRELSGGQKQLLALASIMALQPSVLILDEPTSQLDPIAAGEFLATSGKINRELGVTVILTEHRLEEAFPLSTRAVVMDGGSIIADASPREAGLALKGQRRGMFLAMPAPMRVWAASGSGEDCPVTVRDGAAWLQRQPIEPKSIPPKTPPATESKLALQLDEVWFRYGKDMPDVIKGLSLKANYGEITAILGGNGTGKTTALSIIAGLSQPYRGKVSANNQVFALAQNPQSLFVEKTVREDLLEILSERNMAKDEKLRRVIAMAKLCKLEGFLDFHPYDLSCGEQQRAALAKVLLLQPEILLLDEPTKGLDAQFKQVFATILKGLAKAGAAVLMVSHDVEFCAEHADRCALFFDGAIAAENAPRAFFSGNSFYTTSANRMARAVLPEAIIASDIIESLGIRLPDEPESIDFGTQYEIASEKSREDPSSSKRVNPARIAAASAFTMLLLAAGIIAARNAEGLKSFLSGGNEAQLAASEGGTLYVRIMLALAAGVVGLTLSLYSMSDQKKPAPRAAGRRQRLSKRTIASSAMILLAVPFTIYAGIYFFGDRKYYFTSLIIIMETMLPFALVFESRKPQARELVIISVLCAISVAGRAAFFMLPQFKPVMAMVIISGVAFGGETGFLVGATSSFLSNMLFRQGPWTPWQMFAFGIIGFLAGIFFRKGLISRAPISLSVFGIFSALAVYGPIMDCSSILLNQSNVNGAMLLAALLQGAPFNLVHAAATMLFLIIAARPMLEKLDRIKTKYGLVE